MTCGWLQNSRGISVVELMIYTGIAAWVGFYVAHLVKIPTRVIMMSNAETQMLNAYRSADTPINDIRSALSGTIPWSQIDFVGNPANDPTVMSWFQIHNPMGTSPLTSWVCYAYLPTGGTVVRRFSNVPPNQPTQCLPNDPDANATQQTIVQNILAPTVQYPLYSKDQASSDIVILTLQFPPVANSTTTLVMERRAYIRS